MTDTKSIGGFFHDLSTVGARRWPDRPVMAYKGQRLTYAELETRVREAARGLLAAGLRRGERVAVYLEKRPETVIALLAISMAGGVFVPVNPLLRPRQVVYILRDCGVRVLISSNDRLAALDGEIASCSDLRLAVSVGASAGAVSASGTATMSWDELTDENRSAARAPHRVIDRDMAAILYTSGSTGNPKGVVLSHRNLHVGAQSVSQYLENSERDRILSVLPLSFDAGLSQVTTALYVGAEVVLMNYLLPRDVVRQCAEHEITGLTCVPPLWIQLAEQEWPEEASANLRYFANTGGHMPRELLDRLRRTFPGAKPYLMYGLTEAFRSTYLDPSEVDRRPDSIGKAIPNAEILVAQPDGTLCEPREHGELVHRGALVAMGYWNDPARTAERFRPAPGREMGLPLPETAVWSGDIVYADEEGFLYFVGRRDEMIKTSGYRVSPTEIESVVQETDLVREAVALGVPHPTLGQGIVVVASPKDGASLDEEAILSACRRELPRYMVPEIVVHLPALPRGPNGKIDRSAIREKFNEMFSGDDA